MAATQTPTRQALWDVIRRVVDTDGSSDWEQFLHGPGQPKRPTVTEQRSWFRFEPEGVDFPVFLTLGKDDAGRLVCTGLIAGLGDQDTAITSAALRNLSMPSMIRSVVSVKAWAREVLGNPVESAPKYASRKRGHPGRGGHPMEHYTEVLAAYDWALQHHPDAPIQALRKKLRHLQRPASRHPVPESTIYRWISTAKSRLNSEGDE